MWELGENGWRGELTAHLTDYMEAVSRTLVGDDGFDSYVRLAESRRRRFAKTHLNEFPLLLPRTDIPADMPPLQMRADGPW